MNHDTSSPEIRNWGMGALGTLLVLASVPLAAFVWSLLPEGRYPVIVVAVPALPLLAVGGYLVRRSNIGLEKFMDEHPTAFTWSVVGAMAIALVVWSAISSDLPLF